MLRAALVENSVPAVNTNIFLAVDYPLEYLLGLVNSRLATYIVTKILNTSIGGLSAHPTPEDIRLIPFAGPNASQLASVEDAVRSILQAKAGDPQADYPEAQESIDRTICEVYALSGGAIAAINAYWEEIQAEQVATDGDEEDDT